MNRLKTLRERIDFWLVIKVVCFVLIIVFLVYPLLRLFRSSFLDVKTSTFTLDNYIKLFTTEKYFESLKNSAIIVTVTAISTLFLGIIQAYLMTRFKIFGNNLLKILTLVSLMSPPFIGAYSWILMLGNNGAVRLLLEKFIPIEIPSIYGMGGILLVFALKLFPFIYLYASGALKSIDASLEEAAEGLGTSKLARLFKVTVPLITPTLLSGALLVSMTALADFGTPLLLGRGVSTMPVLIYNEFVSELGGNAYFASAISVVIIILATALFLIQRYIVNRKSFEMSSLRPVGVQKLKGIKNILAHAYCYGLVGLASIPQFTVTYYSFRKIRGSVFQPEYSLENYQRVFDKLSIEIINTFLYSFIALAFMVFLALFIAYLGVRRKSKSSTLLDVFIMLPYIIPGTVIGIMYAVTFNSGAIVLTGTTTILIIVYIIRRGPSVIRSSTGILYQISPSVEEASISLGVSPIKSFFKTTAILMLPGVVSGGLLAWIRTTSELSASIMLYVPKTRTIPVAIYSEIIYGQFGSAAAMSTLLVAITIIILSLFFKFNKNSQISL